MLRIRNVLSLELRECHTIKGLTSHWHLTSWQSVHQDMGEAKGRKHHRTGAAHDHTHCINPKLCDIVNTFSKIIQAPKACF